MGCFFFLKTDLDSGVSTPINLAFCPFFVPSFIQKLSPYINLGMVKSESFFASPEYLSDV